MPRRPTDQVEDMALWMFIAAALLLLVLAGSAGGTVYRDGVARAAAESAQRRQVSAEVVDGRAPAGTRYRTVAARWTAPDGQPVTGRVPLAPSPPAGRAGVASQRPTPTPGATMQIWVDDRGRPARPPSSPAQAAQAGLVAGAVLALLGFGVLGAGWLGVGALVARSNDRRWEREWARVGPRWSRRVP